MMKQTDIKVNNLKLLIATVFITIMMLLSGCGTMMVLFGDNIRYSISGEVLNSSVDGTKAIKDAKVSLECSGIEKSKYQNRKGSTDKNGQYQLSGYWELNDCKIIFKHENYISKTIKIEQKHLIESKGLSRTYKLDSSLNPKANN